MKIFNLVLVLLIAGFAQAATKKKDHAAPTKKQLSFDSQLVEGEIYRPDYSVVTGERVGEGWGVLRLRDNFRDHAASDAGEKGQ